MFLPSVEFQMLRSAIMNVHFGRVTDICEAQIFVTGSSDTNCTCYKMYQMLKIQFYCCNNREYSVDLCLLSQNIKKKTACHIKRLIP